MAVTFDTKAEVAFQHGPLGQLSDLGVDVVSLQHDETARLLNVVMRIPDQADRERRRQALAILAAFEDQAGGDLLTDPTFVWDTEADDED